MHIRPDMFIVRIFMGYAGPKSYGLWVIAGLWVISPIPGHVKWPRTHMHYVQVSVGGYSLIPYAFQVDVEARTSNSAALFTGVQLTAAV